MALALPGDDHDSADGGAGAEVDHEDGLVHVVVVHDGAVGQRVVQVAVDGQRGVTVAPLFPLVTLVVHPRVALVSLVGN